MTVATIARVRATLADAGFSDDLVADRGHLRVVSSGDRHPPADLIVTRLIRFRGISAAEEEGLLFALATADRRPLGTYVPTYHPTMSAADTAIVEHLHARVISHDELRAHDAHDHVAAVFADRDRARAAVDELQQLGLGSDRLGLAVRAGAERAFERDAETDVLHDTEVGIAAGAVLGLLAGLSVAAIALVPGGVVGLGGILALGIPTGLGGAMIGGFVGEAVADRSFTERAELDDVPLEPGQVLVAACSHGHASAVEDVMERHGGQLLLRPSDD